MKSMARSAIGHGVTAKTWAIFAISLLVLCAVTGRLQPHLVPDSASYLDYSFANPSVIASQTRPPGYPVLLRSLRIVLPNDDWALQSVVFCQILLHAFAATGVRIELGRWAIRPSCCWVAAIAIAIGCTFWDHVNTIGTDSPAMSIGVLTAIAVMRVWRLGLKWSDIAIISIGCLAAISLRPAMLWLIPWTCAMMLIRPFNAMKVSRSVRFRNAFQVGLPSVLVLATWCGFRSQTVGDFGLLPFGHANLAAVTTQLLDAPELASLPGQNGLLGKAIADRRIELGGGESDAEKIVRRDGLDLRPVADPANRSPSTMTIEERWDAMTYLVVIPEASRFGRGPVAENRILGELNRQIIQCYPERYVRWWLLAIRRGIWGGLANIVMHPIFLTMIIIVATIAVVRFTRRNDQSPVHPMDFQSLGVIAITYAAANLSFIALSSPTIGRFIDAGMIFLPAWAIAAIMARWSPGNVADRCPTNYRIMDEEPG